jgi:hypothetical protein
MNGLALFAVVALAGVHALPLPTVSPVNLGQAGNFAILSASGISTVPPSVISGNIGVSPITAAAITGFSLIMDGTTKSISTQITGNAFASTYTSPTPSELTTAVKHMETAYTDAAARPVSSAAHTNVGAGLISGLTFSPGVYTWGTNINFNTDIYLKGTPDSVFIFQTTGSVVVGSGTKVILQGGVLAKNIFWQVAGFADIGTTCHVEGIFLVKTFASFKTGSSLNGRIFSQTHVSLDSTTVTQP